MTNNMTTMEENVDAISFEEKKDILRSIQKGETITSVAQIFKRRPRTILMIKKDYDRFKQHTSSEMGRKRKRMESALLMWIKENNQKRIPLDRKTIKHKALLFYRNIEEQESSSNKQPRHSYYQENRNTFQTSDIWLDNFLKQHGLSDMKMRVKRPKDRITIDDFNEQLAKIITQGGYTPDNVFNVGKTRFFWKKLPNKTHIATIEKIGSVFEATTDYKTLLLCSNASGNCTLKPVFINQSLCPPSMNNVDLNMLQLHWRVNANSQLTPEIFMDWFYQNFAPEVKEYMENKCFTFKALLLVDYPPCHLKLKHPNIQVVYYPRNLSRLIQPLNLGIVTEFKLQYIKRTFEHILNELEKYDGLTTIDVWEQFTLYNCVKFVPVALSEVKRSTLNMCWRMLWPACVTRTASELKYTSDLYSDIISLSQAIGKEGFEKLTNEDINELISEKVIDEEQHSDNNSDSGSSSKRMNLSSYSKDGGEHSNGSQDNNSDPKYKSISKEKVSFTANSLSKGIQLADELESFFLQNDPIVEQAKQFQQDLRTIMAPYLQLYEELQKSQPLDIECDANEQNVDPLRDVNASPLTISSDDSS